MSENEVLLKSYMIGNDEYLVLNELDNNGEHYIYMSNKNDEKDILIRKVKDVYLSVLDNEEEFLEALKLLCK